MFIKGKPSICPLNVALILARALQLCTMFIKPVSTPKYPVLLGKNTLLVINVTKYCYGQRIYGVYNVCIKNVCHLVPCG